jgi:hypothetical protein
MAMLYAGGQNPKRREGLTDAQRAYLQEIRTAGSRVYNARARRPLRALEAAGLITLDEDLNIHANGSTSWRITATAKEAK